MAGCVVLSALQDLSVRISEFEGELASAERSILIGLLCVELQSSHCIVCIDKYILLFCGLLSVCCFICCIDSCDRSISVVCCSHFDCINVSVICVAFEEVRSVAVVHCAFRNHFPDLVSELLLSRSAVYTVGILFVDDILRVLDRIEGNRTFCIILLSVDDIFYFTVIFLNYLDEFEGELAFLKLSCSNQFLLCMQDDLSFCCVFVGEFQLVRFFFNYLSINVSISVIFKINGN